MTIENRLASLISQPSHLPRISHSQDAGDLTESGSRSKCVSVNDKKCRLPRGLRWRTDSRYIWFTWRDASGRQHQRSTRTSDPLEALLRKTIFQKEQRESLEYIEWRAPDVSKLALGQVAKLYFNWKMASNSESTVARERRMFRNVLRFLGTERPIRSLKLADIRRYQEQRRKQISPTMRTPVSARTVNYEIYLLRGAMDYADCWTTDIDARYKPLRQARRLLGKVASTDQLECSPPRG